MNLQQLRYAKAVAVRGSFVQAASDCAVSQPTLSNGIAQLEAELGHPLFVRTTRSVRLSEAGKLLLPDIIDILSAQSALVAHARALTHPDRRLVRIGVSPVISVKFVEVVLEPFRVVNSDIDIIYRELNLAEMLAMLTAGQLDFVFGPVEATGFAVSGACSLAFFSEPLVFVPNSRTRETYRRLQSVTLQDIAGETFVMVPDACGLTRTTRDLFRRERVRLAEYSGQALSYGVLQEWAELGIGSAILPQSKLAPSVQPKIPLTNETGPLQINHRCLWIENGEVLPAMQRLAGFLRDAVPGIVKGSVR